MSTLLVLAAGSLQLPAVTTAKRMGLRVVAADGDAHAPGLALADVAYVINILDADACLKIARKEKIDGVVHICSEISMYAMGRINEELGLHGIDSATAVRATNKEQMRQAFASAGAPSLMYIGVTTAEETLAASERIGLPSIVKPSRNSGSRGVTLLTKEDGPEKVIAAFEYAMSQSRDPSALIEEFVEGPEFSVEILIWDGQPHVLTVTDKETTGAPHFVETGHSQPTRQAESVRQAIESAAVKGVRALGIDWAAAHAEIKLSPRGPVLMEIGARLGGDFITTELVPRSTGIDIVEGAINLALGRQPDLKPKNSVRGASIRYLTPRTGKVTSIEGVERAKGMQGVKIIALGVEAGGEVPAITSSLTRVGHVIAEGATAEQAIANAEAARDAIIIHTEPNQP
ncbi:MAG: ATP-grasp domain-containing protein [Planctomycetota bacterium]|nr:ATP-grasp domain-containing protein [Planctomycetota bacterium]